MNTLTTPEAQFHAALKELAKKLQEEHGLRVEDVRFRWFEVAGSPPVLRGVEVTTAS